MARATMLLDNDFTRDGRVRKEAASLAAAGYEVTVVAVRSRGTPERERVGAVEVIRVAPAWWSGLSGPARLYTWRRWYARMAPLGREAARRPAEVIHAHDLTTLLPAWRAARRLGAKLLFDDHELYVETLNTTFPEGGGRLRRALFRRMERRIRADGERLSRRIVPGLDGHVTVSAPIAEEIARRYGVARPALVLNCPPLVPPPPPDDRLRRAAGAGPGDRIVLFAGSCPVRGIGLEDLVDALPLLPEMVRAAILGWGPGLPALVRRAKERGVAGRIAVLPPVPPEELPAWYAGADLAAVPNLPTNLSNLYGLPNKLFEAMMAGTPVVAADSPAIREIVEAHPAGLLYRMGDSPDFAARIREALDAPPAVRAAWSAAGRRAAETVYSWERQAETLLALYARLTGA